MLIPKSHFSYRETSPKLWVKISMLFVLFTACFFAIGGVYQGSYFSWGPPFLFFGHNVESNWTFYGLMCFMFIHQIINVFNQDVTYAWTITKVQNPNCSVVEYSKKTCLTITLLQTLYSQLDMILIVQGAYSQISFMVAVTLADLIATLYITKKYLNDKQTEIVTI